MHTDALPEMPDSTGVLFTVTAKLCAELTPHELAAITLISPLLALAVVVILLVVEALVHPFGSVQEYELAPFTAVIL